MKAYLYLFAIIGVFGFCVGTGHGQLSQLTGREWKLTELNGAPVEVTRAVIEFSDDGRRFTGNTGCNRMFGGVNFRGRTIHFSGIGSTRMACRDRDTMANENKLLTALRRSTSYQISGKVLILFARSRQVAKFKWRAEEVLGRPVADNLSLEDRKWVLTAAGGTAIPRLKEEPFIVFDQSKASAGGNTGCNVFGGSYSAMGSELRITETISTMRACIEDERMQVEREFLDGLRRTDRYEIRVNKLMLYQGRNLLLTFEGRKKV
jgi:heat shock protein HslJ